MSKLTLSTNYIGKILPGKPYPLGANYENNGINFAIFSEHASAVILCLFNAPNDTVECAQIVFEQKTNHVWHAYIPGLKLPVYYGYRINGSFHPHLGQWFNPHKLLMDPYAKVICGRTNAAESMYNFNINKSTGRPDFHKNITNSAAEVNKCAVVDTSFNWEGITKPEIPMDKTIIYETHLKGFTKIKPEIPENEQGTYKGFAHPSVIDYFKDLGITAVELLPVHHFIHNKFLLDKGLSNYWGYNTIGFFAPHAEYSATGQNGEQIHEFKEMVKAYHKAGLEIILDVVFNHSAEEDQLGPTICFKGIDNENYYNLIPEKPILYSNETGCGNVLDFFSPQVLKLSMDSLRYWATEMQVDGFRFDLTTTLLRQKGKVHINAPFLQAIHQDPVLSKVKLIAEPWDLGYNGYQLGNFPVLWGEWNDKYRDTVRKFWRGDEGQLPALAHRMTGSSEIYDHKGKPPTSSINFITAHDGFTLHDLVSYNKKYNQANGENNNDGANDNYSWNSGTEGETTDFNVIELREQRKRNFLATLLFSQGVPMISHGDEYGRTQNGNNNVYCQDNKLSWMHWQLSNNQKHFFEFTKQLIVLRKKYPLFHSAQYVHHITNSNAVNPIRWFNIEGREMTRKEWDTKFIRVAGIWYSHISAKNMENHPDLFLLLNSYWEPVTFKLPGEFKIKGWKVIIDTAASKISGNNPNAYQLKPRSLALLEKQG